MSITKLYRETLLLLREKSDNREMIQCSGYTVCNNAMLSIEKEMK